MIQTRTRWHCVVCVSKGTADREADRHTKTTGHTTVSRMVPTGTNAGGTATRVQHNAPRVVALPAGLVLDTLTHHVDAATAAFIVDELHRMSIDYQDTARRKASR